MCRARATRETNHSKARPPPRDSRNRLTFYWRLKRFGNSHHHVGAEDLGRGRPGQDESSCTSKKGRTSYPAVAWPRPNPRRANLGHTSDSAVSPGPGGFVPCSPVPGLGESQKGWQIAFRPGVSPCQDSSRVPPGGQSAEAQQSNKAGFQGGAGAGSIPVCPGATGESPLTQMGHRSHTWGSAPTEGMSVGTRATPEGAVVQAPSQPAGTAESFAQDQTQQKGIRSSEATAVCSTRHCPFQAPAPCWSPDCEYTGHCEPSLCISGCLVVHTCCWPNQI